MSADKLPALLLVIALAGAACPGAACARKKPAEINSRGTYVEEGLASWYGKKFHGKKTASGERFDMQALTAAHRSLAFGTRVKVTNLDNGKSVEVRINDRGPWKQERIIDLSWAAARKIGMIEKGVVRVRIEVVE